MPRALQLPAGDYTFTSPCGSGSAGTRRCPPRHVLTHALAVPDLNKALTTSSVILATG